MTSYRQLLVLLGLSGLAFTAACSASPAPPPSNPPSATATTVASTAAPAVVPTTAAQATTAPTQGAVSAAATKAPAPTTAPTSAPAQTKPTVSSGTTSSASTSGAKKGSFGQADLDKIFPPGKGQELVFRACVNCHNWVPLVMADLTRDAWQQNKMNHRNRVSGLSDADFDFLYEYLAQSLPAGHPVPDNIPEDLLSQWTSY